MQRYRFGTKNHMLNCILHMAICAATQVTLYFYTVKEPGVVAYAVAAHLVLALGCIIAVTGEIIIMKMELEKKEKAERIRYGFYIFDTIWFGVNMVTLGFLGIAFDRLAGK